MNTQKHITTAHAQEAIQKIRELARLAISLADQMEAEIQEPIRGSNYWDGHTISDLYFPAAGIHFIHYPCGSIRQNEAYIEMFDENTREREYYSSSDDIYEALWNGSDWNTNECRNLIFGDEYKPMAHDEYVESFGDVDDEDDDAIIW